VAPSASNPGKAPLLNTNLRVFLVGMVLANISGEMIHMLLPVYMARLGAGVGEIGLVFSLASLVPLVLQIFGGFLSDSIGRLRTIAIGSLGGSLGYLAMVLAPSWQCVLLALCLEYILAVLVSIVPVWAKFKLPDRPPAEQSAGEQAIPNTGG